MILFLTAISTNGQTREFSCQVSELELAFTVLSRIVAQGDTLLKAQVLDNGHWTQLPVDAFDTTYSPAHITELQKEWQLILDPAIESTIPHLHQERIELTQQLINQYEKRIVTIERSIATLTQLHERAKTCHAHRPAPLYISNHFISMLGQYENQLRKAHVGHQLTVERLSRLVVRT